MGQKNEEKNEWSGHQKAYFKCGHQLFCHSLWLFEKVYTDPQHTNHELYFKNWSFSPGTWLVMVLDFACVGRYFNDVVGSMCTKHHMLFCQLDECPKYTACDCSETVLEDIPNPQCATSHANDENPLFFNKAAQICMKPSTRLRSNRKVTIDYLICSVVWRRWFALYQHEANKVEIWSCSAVFNIFSNAMCDCNADFEITCTHLFHVWQSVHGWF